MPQNDIFNFAEVTEISTGAISSQDVMHIYIQCLEAKQVSKIRRAGLKLIRLLSSPTDAHSGSEIGLVHAQPLAFIPQAFTYP